MSPDTRLIGETLRRLRTERELSLAGVAQQARISIATLSRVETNKQNLDVDLLLTLARILGVSAAEILGDREEADDVDQLSRRLAALPAAKRTKVILQSSRRRDPKQIQSTLDDLVAAVEILRDELVAVNRAVRRQPRR